MKKSKILFIFLGIIFFLTAVTLYLNRVVFPVELKKIVITQAEAFLKRKVEIEGIRFSWVKGFIVDKLKIYQKDSDQSFVQAERISFGIVFIPGFKQHHITIPFINVEHPSAHLIHTGIDQWNFSDLMTLPPSDDQKPSPFAVTVTGVHIIDGKVRLDDVSEGRNWTELLDGINLKLGLSFGGITYDFSTAIPQKQAWLSAQGSYQPITQALETQIRIKNIKPSDYLALIPTIKGLDLKDGLVEDVNLHVNYSKELIRAQGDLSIKNLNIRFNDQSLQADILANSTDITYKNGPLSIRGDFQINHVKLAIPGITAAGDLKAKISQFDFSPNVLSLEGDFLAQNSSVQLSDQHSFKGNIELEKIRIRQDKDGTQAVGTMLGKGLNIHWDNILASGDVTARPITIQMKSPEDIAINGDLIARNLNFAMAEHPMFKGKIVIENIKARIIKSNDITLTGKIAIDDMQLNPIPNALITGSISLPSINLSFKNDTLGVKTDGEFNNWLITLDKEKTIVAEASFNVDAVYPIKTPEQLTYSGTFKLENAEVKGFPFGPFKEINLDTKFKTDELTIKLFSMVMLESSIKGAGSVLNFKAPVLNITAGSEKIDLAKLKDIVPELFEQYGLTTSGAAGFNIQFQGLVSDPLSGKIKANAELQDVSISSTKFNQSVSKVSGTIEGTPDTLSWNNFTGTYQDKTYALTGSLTDFKNPKVKTSLEGQDVNLKADIEKTGETLSINNLSGKYMNVRFNTHGSVALPSGKEPILDVTSKVEFAIKDILPSLPAEQRKNIENLKIAGNITAETTVKGRASDWKNLSSTAKITSPLFELMGYKANDIAINFVQQDGKISNLTIDATIYDGKVHAVSSCDLNEKSMPFDLALNIDAMDMQKLKMDIPALKTQEINGKFYLTTVSNGTVADIKNVSAKGSLAIRDGFLGEFKVFKGLLGILNEGLKLGQVMITDVEGNFVVENQKLTTENLRLKSPTIVLLTQGWVNLDQDCDLNVTVDMTSGIVPPIAEQVLRSLQVRIYDKISNPKFAKKISVPQVLNSIIKTLGIFQ